MEWIPLIAMIVLIVGAAVWMVCDIRRIRRMPHCPMGKFTESPSRLRLSR